MKRKREMAEIIDLDFYRKFRIILPIYPLASKENKSEETAREEVKRYRRRRKSPPTPTVTKKE